MEFLGTFSLIFIGGWGVFASALPHSTGPLIAALTHGALLGIFVYIGAKISGSHYNPAVTLGLLFTGNIEVPAALLYIVSQLLGSTVAGFALKFLKPGMYKKFNLGFPHLDDKATITQGFFMEAFGAFFLIFSIYACAVHRKASPETCAAVIGTTLFFGIAAFGGVTGGALNPARTFGPSIANGEFFMKGWWMYYVATSVGGVFAAVLYKYTLGTEDDEVEVIKEE
jgi:MIP family channel proteins